MENKKNLMEEISMKREQNGINVQIGVPFPLGVRKKGDTLYFSVYIPNIKECTIHLYKTVTKKEFASIHLDEKYKTGGVFSVSVKGITEDEFLYMYEYNGKENIDTYAVYINGRERWGKRGSEGESGVKAAFRTKEFDWENDRLLRIPYSESIFYRLHVRGFTKHRSSGVTARGTFLGIEEKLPYLKGLGITAIELMPAYEFNEIISEDESRKSEDLRFINYTEGKKEKVKLNYWGYAKECNYFAPKASYAADTKYPELELKHLVREAHKNGIEVIFEFCFQPEINKNAILDCLRYWVLEYHADGFKLNDNVVPLILTATDPLLSEVKLIAAQWDTRDIYYSDEKPLYENLAESNDGFLIDVRRFLKSDEGQISAFTERFKEKPPKHNMIHYIANHNGFTLMDAYSYDIKHNEKNGENNRDGTEFNYSWNCGVEGKTRRKKILELRRKQVKNAFLTLVLCQGTPLILAGDEFGNSQNGNNNAYCQDNDTGWLDWNLVETNKEIFEFLKKVIMIRREHPILRMKEPLEMRDYASCGYPDLSFHGTKAWYPDFSNYSRVIGIMLCGKYAETEDGLKDDYFYFAFNMHWEPHEFDLPKLPDDRNWRILIDTGAGQGKEINLDTGVKDNILNQRKYTVNPRTIIVFTGK